LNAGIFDAGFGDGFPNGSLTRLLFKGEKGGVAPEKINPKDGLAAMETVANPNGDHEPGHGKGGLGHLHEINLLGPDKMQHRQRLEPPAVQQEVEERNRWAISLDRAVADRDATIRRVNAALEEAGERLARIRHSFLYRVLRRLRLLPD